MKDPITPLSTLLRELTPRRRKQFAALAATSVSYLYQLAGCHRGRCRVDLALRIAKASEVLRKKYGTPIVTVETLATMCELKGESE